MCRIYRTLLVAALLAPCGSLLQASSLSVADALRQNVRTLSRPIYTYHYTTRAKMRLPGTGSIQPRHPKIKPYLTNRVGRFWDLSVPTAQFETAGGLYIAIDPVITRLFGGIGDSWAVVQVVLPRGFRFLDLRKSGIEGPTPRLPAALRSQLAARGCDTDRPQYLLTTLESKSCRQAAVETLVELDVDGVLYDYPRIQFLDCPDRPQGAFIVLRSQALDLSEAKVFTNEPAPEQTGLTDQLRIRQAFQEARRAGSSRTVPWAQMEAPQFTFESWTRDLFFGCGDYVEDPAPVDRGDRLVNHWKNLEEQRPGSAWSHFNLAQALRRQGDISGAISEYRRALQLEPDFVEAMEALARIYATSRDERYRNPQQAVKLATRLVELVYYKPYRDDEWSKQRKIEASLTLAAASASAGNYDRAVAYANQVIEAWSREDREAGTPQTTRTVSEARRLLELYRLERSSSNRPQ